MNEVSAIPTHGSNESGQIRLSTTDPRVQIQQVATTPQIRGYRSDRSLLGEGQIRRSNRSRRGAAMIARLRVPAWSRGGITSEIAFSRRNRRPSCAYERADDHSEAVRSRRCAAGRCLRRSGRATAPYVTFPVVTSGVHLHFGLRWSVGGENRLRPYSYVPYTRSVRLVELSREPLGSQTEHPGGPRYRAAK